MRIRFSPQYQDYRQKESKQAAYAPVLRQSRFRCVDPQVRAVIEHVFDKVLEKSESKARRELFMDGQVVGLEDGDLINASVIMTAN